MNKRQSVAIDEHRKLVITGGTGYLGSRLLAQLVKRGSEVVLIKRSFSNVSRILELLSSIEVVNCDQEPLSNAFKFGPVDCILHCATNYGRRDFDPLQILETNLLLPLRLLELGEKNGVRCFLNTDTIIDPRISHYALSKRQFNDWLKLYAGKLVCTSVALEHFYGPGDDETKFVSFIVKQLLSNVKKVRLTLGQQERDFTYIDDVVEAIMRTVDYSYATSKGYHRFEVGTNRLISIRDLVLTIRELTSNTTSELDFGAVPYRENEIMKSIVDTRKIRETGWQSRVTLEEGLQRTIEFERKKLGVESRRRHIS